MAAPPIDDRPGLHADCLATLRAYAPDSPDQRRLRDELIEHLLAHPDGWSRECPGAHVTASSLICAPTADEVLLLHHRKLRRWLQTGGHVEAADRTLADAALREAAEESGLPGLRLLPGIVHIDVHEVPCGPVRPCYHLDVRFLVLADRQVAPVGTAESTDIRWFAADDLPTDELSVLVLVAEARRRLGGDVQSSSSNGDPAQPS